MTQRWRVGTAVAACLVALALGIFGVTRVSLSSGHAAPQSAPSTQAAVQVLPPAASGAVVGKSIPTDSLIRQFQSLARLHPGDAASYTNLALAYSQKERETSDVTYYNLTEQAARTALRLAPTNIDAIGYLAWVALGRHDFRAAKTAAERAIALAPRSSGAYATLGDAESNLGEYPAMVKAYQRMVDLKPSLAAYNRVAYVRWLYGDERGAVRFMLLAIRTGSTVPENVAWCQTQLGVDYFNMGFLLGARQQFQTALRTFPHYAMALAGLGSVEAALGHPKMAIDYYRQAIAIVPLPQYITALGDLYASTGRSSQATREYSLIAFIDRTFALNRVRYGIETAQFDADHNDHLVAALRIARSEAVARNDVQTMDTLAWTLYKNGRYTEAWQAEKQAMRLGTHFAPYYFHAGMIQARLGNLVEAQSYLHNALMLNSNFSVLYSPVARAELLRVNARVNAAPAKVKR